ncbi:MAG TPA: hypothetical protein VLH58_12255 [Candidatus Methylomirabilis sp.]|nr:hypothetical protein [Candidatus Methylomirabilis sp.]
MNGKDGRLRGVALLLLLLASPIPAAGQAREVHGENSVFAGEGVAIAWAILKAPMEDQSQVILRIIQRGQPIAAVRIEAVDSFTQKREVVLDGQPLRDLLDVRSLRGSFADFPRREIQLYQPAADWQARRPTATIYYLGVPDTTPEFISESALSSYLHDALAKIQGSEGRKP